MKVGRLERVVKRDNSRDVELPTLIPPVSQLPYMKEAGVNEALARFKTYDTKRKTIH